MQSPLFTWVQPLNDLRTEETVMTPPDDTSLSPSPPLYLDTHHIPSYLPCLKYPDLHTESGQFWTHLSVVQLLAGPHLVVLVNFSNPVPSQRYIKQKNQKKCYHPHCYELWLEIWLRQHFWWMVTWKTRNGPVYWLRHLTTTHNEQSTASTARPSSGDLVSNCVQHKYRVIPGLAPPHAPPIPFSWTWHQLPVDTAEADQDRGGHTQDSDHQGPGGHLWAALGLRHGPDDPRGGPGGEEDEDDPGDQHPDLTCWGEERV